MKVKKQLAPLSQDQYESLFGTFVSTSTRHSAMISLITPVIERLNGKAVKLLSIGAGTGAFENALVTEHGLKLKYYHGVEPNKGHCVKLKATASQWHVEHDITEDEFRPDVVISDGYDIILMAHVMYYVADPLMLMKTARSLLAPGGSVIIFNHTHEGGSELQALVKEKATLPPQAANECLTAQMLSDQLNSAGIEHRLTEYPSTIDVHDFIIRKQAATADHIVSFFMQTPFKELGEPLQSEVYNLVKDRCTVGADNRHKLYHPCALLEISSD